MADRRILGMASPTCIVRTTTSPVLTPTRASTGILPSMRADGRQSDATAPASPAPHELRVADGPHGPRARRTRRKCRRRSIAQRSRHSDAPPSIISCSTGSTIARASSGSRSRINSVEPLMSANNAVTVLRSPSKPSAVCRSALTSTRGIFPTAAGLGDEAGAPAPKAPPHFRQKLASKGFTVLQEEHRFSTLLPHFMQNCASAGLS